MKFQNLPLIALLLFSSLANPAAMELKSAAVVAQQQKEIAQLPQTAHEEELLLSTLPQVLLDIIRDYIVGVADEVFLAILYQPTILENKLTSHPGKIVITNENIIIKRTSDLEIWDMFGNLKHNINGTILDTVVISPDGNFIVRGASYTRKIEIMNIKGEIIHSIQSDQAPVSLTTTSHAKIIFTGYNDGDIKAWNRAGQCIGLFKYDMRPARACSPNLAVTPNGNILTAIGSLGMAMVWNVAEKQLPEKLGTPQHIYNREALLEINNDGNTIVTGLNKSITIYNNKRKVIEQPSLIEELKLTSHGNIIVGLECGAIKILNPLGECIADLTPTKQKRWGKLLAASSDGKVYVTNSEYICPRTQFILRSNFMHKFDNNAHKELYNLTFTQLITLKQLIDDFCKQEKIILSTEQGTFLFSLPVHLQNNIRTHFGIMETQDQFEKRSGQDVMLCE